MADERSEPARVLVTGANRGTLEFVRQYAARGAQVFAGCRRPDGAGFLTEAAARCPGRITVLAVDVTDRHAELGPDESVAGMIEVIDGLSPAQSDRFLTWQGEDHAW